ncbi:MAG: hypothetical protein OSJ74_07980 [Clostridia bacterium]|nr:hypothetical protein [Clostridia bacterium]
MSSNLPKIKIPKRGHYYVIFHKNQQVVAQFVSQACWNLTFRIVDDSYINSVDGEFVCGRYSIIFV